MKKKINKNKGILFWVTGLSGSGKTTISKKIKKDISKNYGPTIVVSGDDLRQIFNLKGYSYSERLILNKKFRKFAKFIINQKINLIFAIVGMFDEARKWNRTNFENYIEIYIKSNIKNIIKNNKKKIYKRKGVGDIVGINIKPELPKKPDITINNNFKTSMNNLSTQLLNKIKKLI